MRKKLIEYFVGGSMNFFMIVTVLTICVNVLTAQKANAGCGEDAALQALALNLYHEARGETIDGMIMIGKVTLNRVENEHFPDNVCDVVYQGRKNVDGSMQRYKCQFSWYCDGQSDRPTNEKSWDVSRDLAQELLDGVHDDFGFDATHYLNPKVVSRMPRWSRVYTFIGSVGDHHFYDMGDRL